MNFKSCRIPTYISCGTFFFYGALSLLLFSSDLQFTKYAQAAAQSLAQTLPAERLVDFSPLYLYLHILQQAYWPGGQGVLVLQLLAVALAAGLLFLLLQRFVPSRVALIGVALFVFARGLLVYSGILEPEALLVSFLIAFLYFVGSDGRRDWLLAGLALALALAVRPGVIPLLAVVPLFYYLNRGRGRWLFPSMLVLLPALLLLLGLSLRNGAATGDYSPLVMNPGFVFYEGNNPLSSGKSAVYPPIVGELKNELADQPDNPHMTYRLIAERSSGRKLTTTEANRYWRLRGLNFMVDYPGRTLSLLVTKGIFILHSYQRHDLYPAVLHERSLQGAAIPTLPFALLATLALAGMVFARRDWRRLLLYYALILSQSLLMLVFYVSERQKLALLPGMVVFAAMALHKVFLSPRKIRYAAGFAILLLTFLLSLPNDLMRDEDHLWRAYAASDQGWLEAIRLRASGRFTAAADSAARGYGVAPWTRDYARPEVLPFVSPDFAGRALQLLPAAESSSQLFDRAQLYLEAGRLDEAEKILQHLLTLDVRFDRVYLQSSRPEYYLAEIALRRGEKASAERWLKTGLRATPGDPFILARLAILTGQENYRLELFRYYSELDAELLLGIAQYQLKGLGEDENLERVTRLLPELRRSRIYHAATLAGRGDVERGSRLYLEATAARREPVLLEKEIISLFAALASGGQPQALYLYGMTLSQYGRQAEAVRILRSLVAISPQPEYLRGLAEVERLMQFSQ